MDWIQVVFSVIIIIVAGWVLSVIWRSFENRLTIDTIGVNTLERLEKEVIAAKLEINELKQEREDAKRDRANMIIQLDQRDAVVRELREAVGKLKSQMQSVTNDYRVQVEHWQTRAIEAEEKLAVIEANSRGRKL